MKGHEDWDGVWVHPFSTCAVRGGGGGGRSKMGKMLRTYYMDAPYVKTTNDYMDPLNFNRQVNQKVHREILSSLRKSIKS